jgi:hypothetical protein
VPHIPTERYLIRFRCECFLVNLTFMKLGLHFRCVKPCDDFRRAYTLPGDRHFFGVTVSHLEDVSGCGEAHVIQIYLDHKLRT